MKICENFVIEINPASCDGEQDFLQNFAEESFLQEILEGYHDDYSGAVDKGGQDEAGDDQASLEQIEGTCSLPGHVRRRGIRSREFILIGKALLPPFFADVSPGEYRVLETPCETQHVLDTHFREKPVVWLVS